MSLNEKSFTTQQARSSSDVIAFYEQYASSWDDRFGKQRSTDEFHRIRLQSFLKLAQLKPTYRAVELGVGTGPYVSKIAPMVKELICVDGSQGMLDGLQARNPGLRNVQVKRLDVEQQGASVGEPADIAYCFGLVEHIIDLPTFAANVRGMLKPGGRFIAVSTNGRSPWYSGVRKLWRAGQHCSSDHYYTVEELNAEMSKHGFAPDGAIYWGWFPAGVSNFLYRSLNAVGKIIDMTPMRCFAGGITVAYRKK